MILSDKEIRDLISRGILVIKPLSSDTVRENGVDLRIGGSIGRFKKVSKVIDPLNELDLSSRYIIEEGEVFTIHPHEPILIHTIEYIEMPPNLIGLINLRSSYARLGLLIPPTVVDAGFKGELTIQLTGGVIPIKLHRGERLIHLILAKTSTPVENKYEGVYKGQRGIRIPSFKKK